MSVKGGHQQAMHLEYQPIHSFNICSHIDMLVIGDFDACLCLAVVSTNLTSKPMPQQQNSLPQAVSKRKPMEVVWQMDDLQKRMFESLKRTWLFMALKVTHLGTCCPTVDFDVWPELMYWNDPASQDCLSSIVGEGDIQLHGVECFDAVDRLAFMASFKQGRTVIRKLDGWESQLSKLVRYSDNTKVRVSATIALSELYVLSFSAVPTLDAQYLDKAAADMLKMLENKDNIDQI
ncbi:hypothetical protein BD769DRAFT_1388294 [Suillus cothurnatus]|nr:hypothetical protein BD769DRAFT_1736092 [Suillus cothurnatus]KAG2125845.1 hypothetical protein BD769DRAFT_1388294 [Suillus cothurnatus]